MFRYHTNMAALAAPILILSAPLTVRAQAPLTPADKTAQTLANTQTLTADFTITTTHTAPFRDLQERGTVALARPGRVHVALSRFRRRNAQTAWEAAGNGSVAVANGVRSWNLTQHPESAQYRESALTAPADAEKLLKWLEPVAGFFNPAARPLLTPGEPTQWNGETLQSFTSGGAGEKSHGVYYADATGVIRRAVVTTQTPGDTVTREVVLQNVRRDVPLPESLWAWTPPPGAVRIESAPRAATPARSASRTLSVGAVAPDFTVEDANGKPVHLSDYRGKVVVLKFWATWCWPCKQSLPETAEVARNNKASGAEVLAVALWDSRPAFRNWTAKNARPGAPLSPIHYAYDPAPQGKDTGSALYGVTTTPTEFVIGRDGRITAIFTGYDGPSPRLAQAVAAASTTQTALSSGLK